MEAKKALLEKVMSITNLIREKYLELIGFIEEMPVTIPKDKNPELNLVALKEYYNSLTVLMKKYVIGHPSL